MSLAAGTRIGVYEIRDSLGAGGMGEVYRARDTRLNRDVALKVLPESLAGDPDRLARLHREAQVLASLNHPNIAIVHGFEESPENGPAKAGHSICALVMELVEGPTLADRLVSGPLDLDEAIPIARQIVDALDAAHEQGVIHRDLKPANIKIRPDGTVKVLDFGLAKMQDGAAKAGHYDVSQSPTVLSPAMLTGVGVIFGTAAYMSPEQARGKNVDTRSDIWAFGCVLYEMLTGQRPFGGSEVSDTLASVLKDTPDMSRVPAPARPLITRCLEKDPRRRLRDIGDAIAMLDVRQEPALPMAAHGRMVWVTSISAILVIAVALLAWMHFREPELTVPPSISFQLQPPEHGTFNVFSFAPNGRMLAFISEGRLFVHSFETGRSRPLASGVGSVFWSSDNRSIAFTADGKLKRIDVLDERVQTICDIPRFTAFGGGSWSPDNVILFGGIGYPVFRVSADGGTPVAVTALEAGSDIGHAGPVFLPDGRHFLFLRNAIRATDRAIYLGSLDSPPVSQTAHRLVASESRPMLASVAGLSDYLMFMRAGTLFAQAFDARELTMVGEAFRAAEKVGLSLALAASASVAGDGTLAYRTDQADYGSFVWVDRSGADAGVMAADVIRPAYPRISPDGQRVAAVVNDELWEYDMQGRPPVKLTTEGRVFSPLWTPDGRRLVYESSNARSLRIIDASPSASSQPAGPDLHMHPHGWSADGKELVGMLFSNDETGADLVRFVPGPGAPMTPIMNSRAREGFEGASLSPDHRWLAYTSDTTGALEVWVQPFPGPGSPVRVSPRGGIEPVWARNGQELYYLEGTKMMAVPIETTSEFNFKPPSMLFDYSYRRNDQPPTYDVGTDGRFLLIKPSEAGPQPTALWVITNWLQNMARAK